MSIGILACESLLEYVEAAQEKLGTENPVFVLDYSGDESPQQMRGRIIGITMLLPREMDTILVAMGFCGGSRNQLSFDSRMVIPKVDDCVSMLLTQMMLTSQTQSRRDICTSWSKTRNRSVSGFASSVPGGK